jgi:hypothetical protein
MNKYGRIYIGYEPGTEEWEVKEGEYEVTEVESKNHPENTDGWDTIYVDEFLDTIVDAGKKLVKEVGYSDIFANHLYNIHWQKLEYEKPSEYYDKKALLVVYYDLDKKQFVTRVDRWNTKSNEFVFYGDGVVYWAELPEPPVQI